MPRKKPAEPATLPTDAEQRSRVYQALMDSLELTNEHQTNLQNRGLSPKEIKDIGYKSIPTKRRECVVNLLRKIGVDGVAGVPGFYRGENGEWCLAGKVGIAIPIRNRAGKIDSIKIRADKPSSPSQKYLLLSSNPKPDDLGNIKYLEGTAGKVCIHFPKDQPKKIDVLRITEGEIKADIATNLTGIYTVSLPGVTSWMLAIPLVKELKPKKILIALDADKTKSYSTSTRPDVDKFAVGKSLAALYTTLKTEGFNVVIEDWPEEAGKGIDDVLINGATDQIKELSGDDADDFTQKMLLGDMPPGWVYIVGVKRFQHTDTLVELDKEQYTDLHMHSEKGNPTLNALKNPALPKADQPIYAPSREPYFKEGDVRYFNLWRKHDLKPEEGDVKVMLEHTAYILPDPKEQEILLDWLAYNIQNPGKKILWAIMLQGVDGTGKSYFGAIMRKILGDRNVSFPSNDAVHEIYTEYLKSCQLVIIEEIMARGRLELMNKLKPMITQDIIMVREMRKPSYTQPNVFNMLMFTNHEDAIIINEHDRRYCVMFSPAKVMPEKYYQKLWQWTDKSYGKILNFFLKRDLSKFSPKGHAPMTAGKRQLIKDSLSPLQAWMREAIDDERWPFQGDLVSVSHLLECLPFSMKGVTTQTLGRALKTLGCRLLGQVPLSVGGNCRLWSVRRHDTWANEPKESLVGEYEKFSLSKQPGGNPLLDMRAM